MVGAALIVVDPALVGYGCRLEFAFSLLSPVSPLETGADKPSRYGYWLHTPGHSDLAARLSIPLLSHIYLSNKSYEHFLAGQQMPKKAAHRTLDLYFHLSTITTIPSSHITLNINEPLPYLLNDGELILNVLQAGYSLKEHFTKIGLIAGRVLCHTEKDPRLNQARLATSFSFDPTPLAPMCPQLVIGRMGTYIPPSVGSSTSSSFPMRAITKRRSKEIFGTMIRISEEGSISRISVPA